MKKLTFDERVEILKQKKPGIELINEIYKNKKWYCEYKCHCGNILIKPWHDILTIQKCIKCVTQKKLTFNDRVEILKQKNPGIILLNEYINEKDKRVWCDYICTCGNKTSKKWNLLVKGRKCTTCTNSEKISFEKKIILLKEINPNIKLLNEYKNENGNWCCTYVCECGSIEKATYQSLRSNKICIKCGYKKAAIKNTINIEETKIRICEINSDIEVLSDSTSGHKYNLTCRCKSHGHIFTTNLQRFTKNGHCPICHGYQPLNDLNEKKQRLFLINPNIEIINECVETKIIEFRCLIDGYIWKTTWSKMTTNKCRCPKCTGHIFTIDDLKSKLNEKNKNIIVLSENYISAHTKLDLKCKIDGNVWQACWANINNGGGCPKCAVLKVSGENCYNWKGGLTPTTLYLRNTIKEWKKDSFKKYNYTCDITKNQKTHKRNNVIHHLYNFKNIMDEIVDTLKINIKPNISEYSEIELKEMGELCLKLHYKYGLGVCLTKKEHNLFHKIYGKNNNTKEQYEEFKNERIKFYNNKT